MSAPIVEPLVSPFIGERFAETDHIDALIAPPYDVVDEPARDALLARDPHNIVRLILPEGNGDKYANAATVLRTWRDAGVLVRDPEPSVYVLRQEFATPGGTRHTRTGLLGALAVEPFGAGRVKPHERTHAEPKADRLALLRATDTVFDALLMLTRDENHELRTALTRVTQLEPLWRTTFDDVHTTMWRLTGQDALHLALAASTGSLYVADGHHRFETAVSFREERPEAVHTLGLIVPLGDPGLVVLPTHRVIHGANVDVDVVVEGLREWFRLHEVAPDRSYVEALAGLQERGTACIVVQPDGNAIALLMKPDASVADLPFAAQPSVASLDVARVDELVVKALAAQAGPEATVRYSADAGQVIETVLHGPAVAGVLVNPTTVEQVLRVADAGAVMPQKATYFTPKVPSGLVLLGLGS